MLLGALLESISETIDRQPKYRAFFAVRVVERGLEWEK